MSTSLVWQLSPSTSLALVVAIASIDDTICLIVAYHRLIVRSSLSASSLHLQRRDRNIVVLKSGKKMKHTFTTTTSSSSPSAVTMLAVDPPYSNNCSRNYSPRRPQLLPSP
ncbi:hypothetical protein B296_00014891 [Ensete ventricosum]|uniref:Uncharacterized protein n=1 Tax=Ensete ventricosum TaxID=4639 RepID=A0A426XIJ5_ENSVE|nr:hypothetical protein B296_00014891 [Ensete ventricosum]